MHRPDVDVVVVGAGVAGLAAAAAHRGLGRTVRVLEATHRVGGLIASERHEGFVLEHGADGLLASDPHVRATLTTLGLDADIVRDGDATRRALIATHEGLYPVPVGLFRFERRVAFSLLASPLLSMQAKLRLFAEPFVGPSPANDESVASFFERRLGVEVANNLVDPMLRGIFGAPASELGMAASMPAIARMARDRGSLGLALLLPREVRPGLGLVTLCRGMASLPAAMAQRLGEHIAFGERVVRIERSMRGFILRTSSGSVHDAGMVVLACPAPHATRLVAALDHELADELAGIETSRADVVTLGYEAVDLPLPDATGFVTARSAGRAIAACTFSSGKWRGRAPDTATLLRVILDEPELDDVALLARVRDELGAILGIARAPSLVRMRRLDQALPRYGVGHVARVARIRERARAELPGFAFAGNAYDGIGIPQCLASGAMSSVALA
jgi:oxygen-dependent protoporphyrinogen oxidase